MTTNFQDSSGEIRLVGTLYTPGATVGDVLTVQSDKSIAAEPGGDSQTVTWAGPFVLGYADFESDPLGEQSYGGIPVPIELPSGAMLSRFLQLEVAAFDNTTADTIYLKSVGSYVDSPPITVGEGGQARFLPFAYNGGAVTVAKAGGNAVAAANITAEGIVLTGWEWDGPTPPTPPTQGAVDIWVEYIVPVAP